MQRQMKFQDLPTNIQDELRDAPITQIEDGKVQIEWVAEYSGKTFQFQIDLVPRNMEAHSIIYVTQDLQDVLVSLYPVEQIISA